jgi:hypothetical protein
MTIKRRADGIVRQRRYYDIAKFLKKPSERLMAFGPFKIDGKDFVAVVYFNRWSYYKWMLRHGLVLLISTFYPRYYMKATSLAATTKGMAIFDGKTHFVAAKDQQVRIARTALVWIDVYLSPVFPPKLFNLVDTNMKLEKRVFENCRNRKAPRARSPAEKLYLEQLNKADEQVIRFHAVFMRYHNLLRNAANLFSGISDRPSETKVLSMELVTDSLGRSFEELAKWCEKRAKSWPNFMDSFEQFKKSKEAEKGLLQKYGPRAIGNLLMSVVAEILSGGNLAFSAIVSMISWFGIEGFKIITSFRWQTRMLKNSAHVYRRFSNRAKTFSKIYDIPLKKNFLR